MKRTRVEIKMTFSADLDPVKGWGDNPNDWATMLEQRIGASNGGSYNMKLLITDINCRETPGAYLADGTKIEPKQRRPFVGGALDNPKEPPL